MKNNSRFGIYYPGFTRKAITFSIDDGDIPNDIKFLDIVRPAGILGTFNISSPVKVSPEEYREIYQGYEIANHCANHPLLFVEGREYVVADEPFNRETAREYTEDDPVIYKSSVENVYRIVKGYARNITDRETYLRLVYENREALEEVFGKGSVKGFVWPYGERKDEWLYRKISESGHSYMRCSRSALPSHDYFDIPEDKTHWSYNASHNDLLEMMEKYDNLSDDGRLKMFSIGVHARDYERNGKWGDLEEFAKKYGNRPNDYFYATNAGIIEYEAATKSLVITDGNIENTSDIDVYMTIDGERAVVKAKSSVKY